MQDSLGSLSVSGSDRRTWMRKISRLKRYHHHGHPELVLKKGQRYRENTTSAKITTEHELSGM